MFSSFLLSFERDGKEIKANKEFVMTVEKDVYILKITEVFPEDTGDYSIVAETPTGEVKSIAEVYVDGEFVPCVFTYVLCIGR